jgi:hypothetical protein
MITNPVVVAMTSCSSALRSSAICEIPGVNIEDASGDRMAINAMMPTLVSLCFPDQARGFSGSSGEKDISLLAVVWLSLE